VAATKLGTAAAAILLQYTAPLWLVPLGFILPFGDRPSRRDLIVAAVCMVGVGLFFIDVVPPAADTAPTAPAPAGASHPFLGIALGLASGLSFALLTGGLRWNAARGSEHDSVPAVLGGNALIALVCLPAMIEAAPGLSVRSWLILCGLGTFQIGAAYMLYTIAVRTVPAIRATLIAMAEPVLNPIFVAIGYGEVPGLGTVIGGGVLLATLAVDAVIPRAAAPPPEPPPAYRVEPH
jgi:drug/metabolite transporter (DMT)-like permease